MRSEQDQAHPNHGEHCITYLCGVRDLRDLHVHHIKGDCFHCIYWFISMICFDGIVRRRYFVLLKNPWRSAYTFSFVKVIEHLFCSSEISFTLDKLGFRSSGFEHIHVPLELTEDGLKFCQRRIPRTGANLILWPSFLHRVRLWRISSSGSTAASIVDFFIGKSGSWEIDVETILQHLILGMWDSGCFFGFKVEKESPDRIHTWD